MSYHVTKSIPYENDYTIAFSTLDEVCQYISDEGGLADWSDYDIIEIASYPDIYEIMAEWNGRNKLTPRQLYDATR